MTVDAEVVALLRRPLPPESVGFKVQTNPKQKPGGGFTKGLAVAFIDARTVVARLNTAVPGEWADTYFVPPIGTGLMCGLTVRGVTRCDIGFSSATNTDMGVKGLYSDAFKRAGVKFEIGAFLYALPKMYVDASDLTQRGDKWFMPDRALGKLRGNYGNWLRSEGVKYFGEPLAQGDSTDPQGDVETTEQGELEGSPASPEPSKPSLPEFARAAIRAKDPKQLPDAEWELIKSSDPKPTAKELWDMCKTVFTEQGGDAKALHDNWKRL